MRTIPKQDEAGEKMTGHRHSADADIFRWVGRFETEQGPPDEGRRGEEGDG